MRAAVFDPLQPNPPGHTAVLVIDVQAGLFCTQPPPFEARAVITRINRVIGKARRAGVPVLFIQHDGAPSGEWLVPFSNGWKLHPQLRVRPGELIIRKTTCDAFYQTSLENELRSRRITTLVLMGYATDFCIDSTVRNAVSKDFRVIVVGDAHTTIDNPILKAEEVRRHHNWAWAESISRKGLSVVAASEVSFA